MSADRSGGDALAELFDDVLVGRYPAVDGGCSIVPPDRTTGLHAVLGFTGHAVICTDRTSDQVQSLGLDGYGAAHHPDALRALAGPDGWVGVLDVVLVARGTGRGGTGLSRTDRHDDHDRVVYARATRADVEIWADERGLITLGRGLGGRRELGVELLGDGGRGAGRSLLHDLLAELPAGTPIWASCAPGNARSLRALLAVGFEPVGSEVLLRPSAGGEARS